MTRTVYNEKAPDHTRMRPYMGTPHERWASAIFASPGLAPRGERALSDAITYQAFTLIVASDYSLTYPEFIGQPLFSWELCTPIRKAL